MLPPPVVFGIHEANKRPRVPKTNRTAADPTVVHLPRTCWRTLSRSGQVGFQSTVEPWTGFEPVSFRFTV